MGNNFIFDKNFEQYIKEFANIWNNLDKTQKQQLLEFVQKLDEELIKSDIFIPKTIYIDINCLFNILPGILMYLVYIKSKSINLIKELIDFFHNHQYNERITDNIDFWHKTKIFTNDHIVTKITNILKKYQITYDDYINFINQNQKILTKFLTATTSYAYLIRLWVLIINNLAFEYNLTKNQVKYILFSDPKIFKNKNPLKDVKFNIILNIYPYQLNEKILEFIKSSISIGIQPYYINFSIINTEPIVYLTNNIKNIDVFFIYDYTKLLNDKKIRNLFVASFISDFKPFLSLEEIKNKLLEFIDEVKKEMQENLIYTEHSLNFSQQDIDFILQTKIDTSKKCFFVPKLFFFNKITDNILNYDLNYFNNMFDLIEKYMNIFTNWFYMDNFCFDLKDLPIIFYQLLGR